MSLDKRYDPKVVENGKYEFWKAQGYFTAGDVSKPPFSLVIPPPNVTGKLHIGHAWNTTFQDIIARYKKAKGFDVLWLAGMDHAGIATQAKVDARLVQNGTNRYELGREGFLKAAWSWKEEYAEFIRQQWAKLGLALDYSRERFTLDEGLNQAVKRVFVDLYRKGLIYQGERIINWDPVQKTALSNIEVIYKEVQGKFYYFKYPLEGGKRYLEVATTRPETMFGDVCVVVNPNDPRYEDVIGRKVMNPANHMWLPVIADEYVDISFGTGAMKCTPAHDPNDFLLGEKHHLEHPICMKQDGTMNDLAGDLSGLDRFVAREKLVERIEKEGFLVKIEPLVHQVGHSERTDAIIEPYLSKQWFVKMSPLAEQALNNQDSEGKVEFIPERFEKIYRNWMDKVEDWCISRQLWWGHRIPAYYHKVTGEVYVDMNPPQNIEDYTQDDDVLDTWFSSALWPFSTLGWPEETEDFKRYFPLDVMVTAYDIIFFWVSRMMFQSLEFTQKVPFKQVVIHGLIRDQYGRKMSKSLGNGIDPMDVIDRYGADALRYFLTTNSTPGQDSRYIEEKVESSANYLNKIWNAARYILMNLPEDFVEEDIDFKSLNQIDRFLISRLNQTIRNVSENMDKYELGMASTYLYNFVYDDFCSWYLEMSKVTLQSDQLTDIRHTHQVLFKSLKAIISMIYPFTPFLSEELYQSLPGHRLSIMEEPYAIYHENEMDMTAIDEVNNLIAMIKDIRNYKVENDLAPNEKIHVFLSGLKYDFERYLPYLKRFGFIEQVTFIDILDTHLEPKYYPGVIMAIEDKVDKSELKVKLKNEISKYIAEVERCEKMLSNANFVAKAPAKKIEEEKAKLQQYQEALHLLQTKLAKLG